MLAKKKHRFEPDFAVPPGVTLQEVTESLGMTQTELATRTELTPQTLNRIAKGEQPITFETAGRLELVTGVPASFWNNLESQYREQRAKLEERERMKRDTGWLKSIPVKDLQLRGYLPTAEDEAVLVREALAFYGVSSVAAWKELWEAPAVAARRSTCFETLPGPASAWIRIGELEAQKKQCLPYDRNRFRQALMEIRQLTQRAPEASIQQTKQLCADAGVALVFVPRISKVPWNGATKWITPTKAMILMSLRGKSEDRFWFSFFHEAGHVLHDNKRALLINDETEDDERERTANEFAADYLIPAKYDDEIRSASTKAELHSLADRIGVGIGIVVGRYQYLTQRWNHYNDMIRPINRDLLKVA